MFANFSFYTYGENNYKKEHIDMWTNFWSIIIIDSLVISIVEDLLTILL